MGGRINCIAISFGTIGMASRCFANFYGRSNITEQDKTLAIPTETLTTYVPFYVYRLRMEGLSWSKIFPKVPECLNFKSFTPYAVVNVLALAPPLVLTPYDSHNYNG